MKLQYRLTHLAALALLASCQAPPQTIPSTSPSATVPPVSSATPSPIPTATSDPIVSPTPNPTPSVPQPTASPQQNSLQAKDNLILATSRDIQGPLQFVTVNNEDKGLIFWFQGPAQKPRVHGQMIQNLAFEKPFQFQEDLPFEFRPAFEMNSEGNGLLSWTKHITPFLGPPNPRLLESLSISNGTPDIGSRSLGQYNLHDIVLDKAGNGWLLVSNEKGSYRTTLTSTTPEDYTKIYRIPVQKWQAQLEALDTSTQERLEATRQRQESQFPVIQTIPYNAQGEDVVLGGHLEMDGTGFSLWQQESKTYLTQIENFQATQINQELTEVPTRFSLYPRKVEVKNGTGYLGWMDNNGQHFVLNILPVTNNKVSPNNMKSIILQSSKPLRLAYGSYTGGAPWAYSIQANGTGLVAWLLYDTSQRPYAVHIQKVVQFSLSDESYTLNWPDSSTAVPTAIELTVNEQGNGFLAGVTASCSYENGMCTGDFSGRNETVWARKIRAFKPE